MDSFVGFKTLKNNQKIIAARSRYRNKICFSIIVLEFDYDTFKVVIPNYNSSRPNSLFLAIL